MQITSAFKTSDGRLFLNEADAAAHEAAHNIMPGILEFLSTSISCPAQFKKEPLRSQAISVLTSWELHKRRINAT